MGSLLMRSNHASANSYLAGRNQQAGQNVIGRTTIPEFGVCSSAENPAVHLTRNPWNLAHTTCGSPAGTAAAVAADVLPLPEVHLTVVAGATHLFEEPGALEAVARHAAQWFEQHLHVRH